MDNLATLLRIELAGTDYVSGDPGRLYVAIGQQIRYKPISGGMFFPAVGIAGDWSERERGTIRDVISAFIQSGTPVHEFCRSATGRDDAAVARYRPIFELIGKMKPGDVARARVGSEEYHAAAFYAPRNNPTASATVLFLKPSH